MRRPLKATLKNCFFNREQVLVQLYIVSVTVVCVFNHLIVCLHADVQCVCVSVCVSVCVCAFEIVCQICEKITQLQLSQVHY